MSNVKKEIHMTGIKETKEVLEAVNELACVIIKHVRDGVQFTDVPAIILELVSSDSFRTTLTKAIENVTQVPGEIADLDVSEGSELAIAQTMYLPKILAALKG
jgi:hypothetical protein